MPTAVVLFLAILSGVLFCTVHVVNGWLLQSLEFSEHISFLYLPSFLRLFNVLVLGLVWGTLGTAIGGCLLFFWLHDSLFLSIFNTTISASSAALAVWVLSILQRRKLSITRLSDLLQLALFCALLNALLHHLMWSFLDPSQLVSSDQLALMAIGDINGAIVGAVVLRWVASRSSFIQHLRQKATSSTQN